MVEPARQSDHVRQQYSSVSAAVVDREETTKEEEEEGVPMLDMNNKLSVTIVSAGPPQPSVQIKVYRRRWLMLAIFVLIFMTNAFQWIQFSIINNLITKSPHFFLIATKSSKLSNFYFLTQVLRCGQPSGGLDFVSLYGCLHSANFPWCLDNG